MRKRLFWVLCVLLTVCCCTALAATGTTDYALDIIYARVTLSDSYIVLTPENLKQHPDLLLSRNTTEDATLLDWNERGVLLQAWVPSLDACLEIRAVKDEDAATYFNINAQSSQARSAYRAAHLKSSKYSDQGYDIKTAEWTKTGGGIRFLKMQYKRNVNGLITWGYADKTVYNGYSIILDYQVYGRGLREKDFNSLAKVLKTVTFLETLETPKTTKGTLTFSSVPPTETSSSTFTVEGTATPGAHLIGVVMKYANPTPKRIEMDANAKSGKFKMDVKLDSEGIWLMTLTVEKDGTTLAEHVFEPTTYQKTLLPVTLDTPVPEQFDGNEFTLSGKTSKQVNIQCIVSGGAKLYDKSVRTNNSGKFSFKFPTDTQSEYSITLVFQKKNYDTRRLTWTANRTLTEKDIQNQYKAEAVKPAYSTLTRKLEDYTGRIMGYKVYITDIQQVGEEYLVFAAITKTKKGTLKDIIVIETNDQPIFVVGSEQTFYGRLNGAFEEQSEEETVRYPCFDLLFWE